jgi:tRNA(Ile2) C34 agmatinyltransferase TiaS
VARQPSFCPHCTGGRVESLGDEGTLCWKCGLLWKYVDLRLWRQHKYSKPVPLEVITGRFDEPAAAPQDGGTKDE